ncbi:hypothetical protein [Prosthecobacter sp.]|uniref:hypothetical protein n=1 Tax=Prosthecobacter sp. TaxID=1965333 RepID=UPI0037832659
MNKNLVALLVSGVFVALVWLIWRPTTKSPAAPPKKPAPVLAVTTAPAAEVATVSSEEKSEPKHYRPKPVSEAVRRKVDAFIARYKDASPDELNKSGELAPFMERLGKMMETPEFQTEMEKRMDLIKAAKGHEHGMLSIGTGKLDSPESRAWLEAMFAEDADLLQEYMLNKLDGAIFEFAFDPTMEQTRNGVTVKSTAPAPAAAPEPAKLPD